MVLLNKGDFLTEDQRRHWAQYFKSRNDNLKIVFFSALDEASLKDDVKDTTEEVSDPVQTLFRSSVVCLLSYDIDIWNENSSLILSSFYFL